MNSMEEDKVKKIRNIPHVDGNFNVYFYIKIKQAKKINYITEDIINIINNTIYPFEKTISSDDEFYHISLSKTFFIKYHEINNYINKIKIALNELEKFTILLTSKIKYFKNDFNTRHFLTLEVFNTKKLKKLLLFLNEDDGEFLPHISILWSNNSFSNMIQEEDLNIKISQKYEKNKILKTIEVSEIYYVIGSITNKIKLKCYSFL